MSDLYNKYLNKGKHKTRVLLALIVCFTIILSSLSPVVAVLAAEAEASLPVDGGNTVVSPSTATSSATKTYNYTANDTLAGKDVSGNNFVLRVATGNSAGDGITCFEVRYKTGSDSLIHSEFIFPKEGKVNTYKFGKTVGINYAQKRRVALVNFAGTYEPASKITEFNYTDTGVLKKNSTDTFYFSTSYDFKSLVDIRVYGNYKTGNTNAWAYKAIELYRVTKNYGLYSVNNVSFDMGLLFDGTLIAKNTATGNCSWSGKDQMFIFSTSKTGKFKLDTTESAYSSLNDRVIVEIDVADVMSAALSMFATSYDKNTLKDLTVVECLNLEIDYTDKSGCSQLLNIPLVTSYFADIIECIGSDVSTDKINGIFQQGDTIAFKTFLPGYATISKCKITYTKTNSDFDGKVFDLSVKSIYKDRLVTDSTFSVSAIRIYDGNQYSLSYQYDGSGFVPVLSDTSANPLYCCVSSAYAGNQVTLGSSAAVFTMNKYERGDRTKASIGSNTYLIAVTTDGEVDVSGTTDDIKMKLSYTKTDGTAVVTEEYKIRDFCDNFYGFWTSEKTVVKRTVNTYGAHLTYGTLDKCGSYYYTEKGRTLYFTINLSDVSSFTSATLSIDGTDEWQISSFFIYQLASLSRRKTDWQEATLKGACGTYGVFSFETDRVISREFDGIMCVQYEKTVLIQNNESKELSFSNGTVADNDTDWSQYSYYMSYEDTKQNLGFTKVRYTYTVTVQVGDDVDGENDCGSKNQFYFQLIFASGKSGYVLANQQLSADGFRTGVAEKFEISVNRDYGELKAIHIIPQNPNDSEEVFDKLKIDYISVSKNENSGVSLSYRVDIDDWISIDYTDTAAQDTVSGQAGKSESEMARTYVVTATGYTTNILVAVTTGAYSNSVQFSGHIFADIGYRDKNGIDQIMSDVDVTALMYEYAGKTANAKISVSGKEYSANDKSFMMREYHTDRFMISIDDVTQIQSIQFHVYSNETGEWNISNVSMYLVENAGQRTINANQEYEIACEKSLLTSSDTDTFAVPFTTKTTYSTEIQLLDNTIDVDTSGSGVTAQVDYVPLNKDDTMNIYVYMSSDATPVANYDMKCAVSYAVNLSETGADTITDKIYQKSVSLKSDTGKNVFYAMGISASGLVNVCSVKLKADTYSYVIAHVDHVVVEHVRSGVAIASYNIPMYGGAAYPLELSGVPTGSVVESSNYHQVVEFMLTEESQKMILGYKSDDIAVSISYTALDGETTHKLVSPNVFLSETDTTSVCGGKVCTVNFNQPDVSSITGISFIAMGKIIGNVGIKSAYAANYLVDASGEETCVGWYSFASGLSELAASSRTLALTASTNDTSSYSSISVSPVTLTVKTAEAAQTTESGTTCPVRMDLGYTDVNGNERYFTAEDINSYAVSGSTGTGKTITLRMLVNNLTDVRSVEFEPYTKTAYGTGTSWTIENISMTYNVNGVEVPVTRAVNSTASQYSPLTVNLSDVSYTLRAFSHNPKTNASYNKLFSGTGEASEGVLIIPTQQVTLTPTLSGSSQGITCSCYKVIDGTSVEKSDLISVYGTSTNVRSVVFGIQDGSVDTGVYRIVFKSVEFPDITFSINIIVEEEETTTAATTEDSSSSTTEPVSDEPSSEEASGENTSSEVSETVSAEETSENTETGSQQEEEQGASTEEPSSEEASGNIT